MKQIMNILIIVLIVIAGIVIIKFWSGGESLKQDLKNESRPPINRKPTTLVENDKLIQVSNLKLEYLKKAITQYCNINNQSESGTLPSVVEYENNYFIFFPYNTDFENFCYFVNYIQYAHELCLKFDYKPKIKAWCTLDKHKWVRNEMIGKKAFIYIPSWDEEYDNVYLTTEDNTGYKMGFAVGETCQKLDRPASKFEERNNEFKEFKDRKTITFE